MWRKQAVRPPPYTGTLKGSVCPSRSLRSVTRDPDCALSRRIEQITGTNCATYNRCIYATNENTLGTTHNEFPSTYEEFSTIFKDYVFKVIPIQRCIAWFSVTTDSR